LFGGSLRSPSRRRGSDRDRLAGVQEPAELDVAHAVAHGLSHQLSEAQMFHGRGTEPAVALARLDPYLHEHLGSWQRRHTGHGTRQRPNDP
jgi:hypothetical protein